MKYYRKLWKHEKYFYIIVMAIFFLVTLAVCNLLKQYKEYIDPSPYGVFMGYVVALEILKNYSKNNEPARNFIRTLPVKKIHIETFHYCFGLLTFLPSMLLFFNRVTKLASAYQKEILEAMVLAILFFAVVQVAKLLLKKELLALAVVLFLYLCLDGTMQSILKGLWELLHY